MRVVTHRAFCFFVVPVNEGFGYTRCSGSSRRGEPELLIETVDQFTIACKVKKGFALSIVKFLREWFMALNQRQHFRVFLQNAKM